MKTKTGILNHVYSALVKTKEKFANLFFAHQQNVKILFFYRETVAAFAKAFGIIERIMNEFKQVLFTKDKISRIAVNIKILKFSSIFIN